MNIRSNIRRFIGLVLLLWVGLAQVMAQVYRVGDLFTAPDGSQGIVYWLNPDGSGGWVVALNDASDGCVWGEAGDIPGLDNQNPVYNNRQQLLNDTAGYAHTQAIRSYQNNATNTAAGVVDFAHGWYLPSPAQLSILYGQLPFINAALVAAGGSTLTTDYYWCSAEVDSDNAWYVVVNFNSTGKTASHRVRAVRSFTYAPADGVTYAWSDGSTGSSVTVLPSETATWSVTATNGSCDASDTVTVTRCATPCEDIPAPVTIGSGTSANYGNYLPLYTYYKYSYTQQIIPASLLNNEAQSLGNIAFQYFYPSTFDRNVDIYLAHVPDSLTLADGWIVPSTDNGIVFSQVFSGTVTLNNTGTDNWFVFPFSENFAYNGTDNLLIAVLDHSGYWSNGNSKFYTHNDATTVNMSRFVYRDGSTYDPFNPDVPGSLTNYVNNIRFNSLSVGNITYNSADLFWSNSENTSSWEVEYKPAAESSWISAGSTDTAYYHLTGLNPNTSYTARVRALCAESQTGNWSPELNFTTPCNLNSIAVTHIDTAVCISALPLTWQGHTFTDAGAQSDTTWDIYGCTSTVTVYTLTITPSITTSYDTAVCASDLPITWKGHTFTEAETYTATLQATNGCDSTVTLTLNTATGPALTHTPDTAVNADTPITLWANGAETIVWTNAAGDTLGIGGTLTVTPTETTTYYVTGKATSGNIVVNGDFEQGNTGFTSEYIYPMNGQGYYGISDEINNRWGWYADHTSGSGKYMVIDGALVANKIMWSETLQVQPHTLYNLTGWLMNLSENYAINESNKPRLQFNVNGTQVGDILKALDHNDEWLPFSGYWNSGDTTTAVITIIDQNTLGGENDFAIDDITFSPVVCETTEAITVTVNADSSSLFNGLVAYYPFDDDDLTDHTGNGNDGNNHGTTSTTDRFCREGKARNFAGVDNPQYIEVPNSSTLQFTDAATVSLWFCMNGKRGENGYAQNVETGNCHKLFTKDYDRYGRMQSWLSVLDNGEVAVGSLISSSEAGDTLHDYQLGQWMQATFVYTTTYIEVFLNGQLLDHRDSTNSFDPSNSRNLFFGGMNSSNYRYPLNGKLDDIRIFNRALDAGEVEQLYLLDIVPQDSLLVYLPLNGNVTDYSGNGFQPVLHGNVTPTAGHYGDDSTAYHFPGEADSWIEIPNDSRLNLCGSFTVSAWYNREVGWQYGNLVSKGRDVTQGWKLGTGYVNVNGSPNYGYDGMDANAQVTPVDGNWYMTTGVYDSATSTLRYYLNGELQEEVTNCGTPLGTNHPVAIGRHVTSTSALSSYPSPFKGEIDDIVIYNRPLSADEVRALYVYNPHATGCVPAEPDCQEIHFLSDDFNDGIIDTTKWTYTGNAVLEEDGQLKLQQNVTDQDVHLRSVDMQPPASGKVAMDRRFMLHYNSIYGGTSFFYLNGGANGNNYVGIEYANNSYNGWYGTYLVYYLDGMADGNRIWLCDASFDTWVTDHVELDFAAGTLSYYLDTLVATVSIPGLSNQTVNYYNVEFRPYGWWTGHQHYMDWVDIYGETGLVSTNTVGDITTVSATCGGSVSADSCDTFTASGICWSTEHFPTLADAHTTDGTGLGEFTSALTGLESGTTYYVRAYATNSMGTVYGNEVSFTTLAIPAGDALPCPGAPTVTDHEGNEYATVQIGDQCWMRDNLRTTTSPSTGTYLIPAAGTGYTYTGKQAFWYNNDSAMYAPMNYGLLYNWNAAVDTFNTAYGETSVDGSSSNAVSVTFSGHRRGICPAGWHLPSDAEWTQLQSYVGSQSEYQCGGSGIKLAKALSSETGWNTSTNSCAVGNDLTANNATGFSAVPAGYCGGSSFADAGRDAHFWSSAQYDSDNAWSRGLFYYGAGVYWGCNGKYLGYSVRCLRDDGCLSSMTEFSASACDSYTWNGQTYTESGDYTQTFTNAAGCDSVVTLHLTVNPLPVISAVTASSSTICQGSNMTYTASGDANATSYIWYLNGFEIPGENQASLTLNSDAIGSTEITCWVKAISMDGCESELYVGTTTVTVNPIYDTTFNAEICQSDSYNFFGQNLSSAGTYTHTLQTIHGCDSIINLILTVNSPVTEFVEVTACDSYTWNGQTYTESGDYTQTFTTTNGCDSVVTLHLIVTSCIPAGDAQPCPGHETVTDYDGNVYNTVKIGEQCWMKENLRVTHYADGVEIPAGSGASLTVAYRYAPNNNYNNVPSYGYLYNWAAVMHGVQSSDSNPSDVQGICPTGWHVPSDAEWTQLTDYVSSVPAYVCGNNTSSIAKALSATTGWNTSSSECTPGHNQSQNNAAGLGTLPTGYYSGDYHYFGVYACYWSATEESAPYSWKRDFHSDHVEVSRVYGDKANGFAVRCVLGDGCLTSVTEFSDTICADSYYPWSNQTYSQSGDYTVTQTFTNTAGCDSVVTLHLIVTSCIPAGDAQPCPGHETVTDYDGNVYNTVKIGEQCWMKENLRVTHYADGTAIPTGGSNTSTNTPYYYINPNLDAATYGYYYNWPAAMHEASSSSANPSGVQGVCPMGWHLPSDAEWTKLTDYTRSVPAYVCSDNNLNIGRALAYPTEWNASSVECAVGVGSTNSTIIGDGTSTTSNAPMNQYYMNSWTQMIYPAANFETSGYIQSLSWNVYSAQVHRFQTLKIYVGTTMTAEHTSTTDWLPIDSLTLVYEAYNDTLGSSVGWETYMFSTPYWLDSDKNLVVVVARTSDNFTTSPRYLYTDLPNSVLYRRSDISADYGMHPGGNSGSKVSQLPNMRVDFVSSTNESYNATGFSAIPAGDCVGTSFNDVFSDAYLWSSSEYNSDNAWLRFMYHSYAYVFRGNYNKDIGFSVRCVLDDGHNLSAVATNAVSGITTTTATCGGNVTSDGGAAVTARGVCWNTTGMPTLADAHTSDGTGTGEFTSSINGLEQGTTYYVRAYATNSVGTVYGNEVSFTTLSIPAGDAQPCPGHETVTDYDGNVYNTVKIGEQCWMKENLKVTHYEDGVEIPAGSDTSSTVAYRYTPGNDYANVPVYGYLYNWTAVMHGANSSTSNPSGVQGICPNGWHVPSDAEWTQLTDYVSSVPVYWCGSDSSYIAKALASTEGWNTHTDSCAVGNDLTANNATGFSAVPAGSCDGSSFYNAGNGAQFWSSTGYWSYGAWSRSLYYINANVGKYGNFKYSGFSVRCLRDDGCLSSMTEFSASACDSYTWNGQTYTESGDYTQTFTTTNGCDSVVTLHLTVNPTFNIYVTDTTCTGHEYNYYEFSLTPAESGVFNYEIQNYTHAGCDSIVHLELVVYPSYQVTEYYSVCENDLPYLWHGLNLVASGTYIDTMTTTNGCDSVVTLFLTVLPSYNYEFSDTICAGSYYPWNNQTYTQSGDYTVTQTFTSAADCDSVVTLHLTVNSPVTEVVTVTADNIYMWNGQTYTQSGDYTQTFTAANGCDSVVTLHLTINNTIPAGDALPCPGHETVTDYDGNVYNTVKIGEQCWMKENLKVTHYEDGVEIPAGSDTSSIVAYRYTPGNDYANVPVYGYLYNWTAVMHGANSSTSNPSGVQGICPNGWHVPSNAEWTQLTDYVSSVPAYWCGDNSSYIAKALASTTGWTNGDNDCAAGNNQTLNNLTGLGASPAGIFEGNLGIHLFYGEYADYWSVSQSYITSPVSVLAIHKNENIVFHTSKSTREGISVRCLLDPPCTTNFYEFSDTICESDSYAFFDTMLTTAGTYTHTLQTVSGCDSVVTLHLTVHPSVTSTDSITLCENELPYLWNGLSLMAGGTYTDTMQTVNGCDSIETLFLIVFPAPTVTSVTASSTAVCLGSQVTFTATGDANTTSYIWYANGEEVPGENAATLTVLFNEANNYLYAAKAVSNAGCVSEEATSAPEVTVSPSYTVAVSGNGDICEGDITTLTATVNNVLAGDVLNFQWYKVTNGIPSAVYGANTSSCTISDLSTGTYYYYVIVSGTSGCSAISGYMPVNVASPSSSYYDTVVCDSYTWNGVTYTQSGTYTQTFTNAAGCDSTVTLNLIINQSVTSTISVAVCADELPYLWNGVTYTQSGTYTQYLTNSMGCDSTVTMNLTVYPTYQVSESASICQGDSYDFFGQTLTTAGTYSHTLTTVFGCDSVITLTLTVVAAPTLTISADHTTMCAGGITTLTASVNASSQLPNNFSYEWIVDGGTPVTGVTSTYNLTLPTAGIHTVQARVTQGNTFGCTSALSSAVTVLVAEQPAVSMYITSGATVCAGGITTMNATVTNYGNTVNGVTNSTIYGSLTSNWTSNGSTVSYHSIGHFSQDQLSQTLLTPGNYTYQVAVTAAGYNCLPQVSNAATVTVTPAYTATISGNGNVCEGNTVTLNATVGNVLPNDALGYQWYRVTSSSTSLIAGATSSTYVTSNLLSAGSYDYYVVVTSTIPGCGATSPSVPANVNSTSSTSISETACGSYTWYGQTYTASGDYTHTLTNAMGCDSVVTLHLTIRSIPSVSINGNTSVNYGQSISLTAYGATSYIWSSGESTAGITVSPTTTTTYTVTGTSQYGCTATASKTVTVNLVIPTVITTNVTNVGTNSATGGGEVTSTGGATVTTRGLCWSTSHNPSLSDSHSSSGSGLGSFTKSISGLTPNTTYYVRAYATNSVGTAYGNEVSFTTTCNTVSVTITGSSSVNYGQSITLSASGATSYTWSTGETSANITISPTENTTYTVTGSNQYGCTATASKTVTVNPVVPTVVTNNISYVGTNFANGGGDVTSSGGATVTARGVCWSTSPSPTLNDTHTSDGSGMGSFSSSISGLSPNTTYHVRAYATNSVGTGYGQDVSFTTGCVNSTYQFSLPACDSYTWNGITYTQSGDYTQTLTNAIGCDSIVTLHLTVNHSVTSSFSRNVCDSYTWNGITYTQSGDYTHTFFNSSGCDSIVTLHLTIRNSVTSTTSVTECDSYNWNGQIYTESGTYVQTLTAANGCDSTVTMYLTILHSDTVSVELIVCDSYEWNGITYTESGDYTQTLTAANGCDSVVKLHLTVNDCNAGIIVYPNPASNSLHIHIPDPAILEDEQDIYVFMYDAAGHLVFKQQIFTLDTELILPPLRNGLYPLEVNVNGKAMKTFKQVIFHEQ